MQTATAKARYALRVELTDGTLEEPFHYLPRKADALRAARACAKGCAADTVRVWVDDTRTDIGVFKVEARS